MTELMGNKASKRDVPSCAIDAYGKGSDTIFPSKVWLGRNGINFVPFVGESMSIPYFDIYDVVFENSVLVIATSTEFSNGDRSGIVRVFQFEIRLSGKKVDDFVSDLKEKMICDETDRVITFDEEELLNED